tara:strand:+ start:35051 stop:35881 length:831 start_codon:yes stop_codon:yes gene_type:complete
MRRIIIPFISLFILVTAGCKGAKKNSETAPEAQAAEATSSDKPVAPWRVGFGLDDSKTDVFIPRPGKPDGSTKVVSFISKRAKDIATWERIALELADGSKEVLAPDRTVSYELRQHEGAGVDLVLLKADGTQTRTIGPLARLHIYTKSLATAAPRIDGKAVLIVNIGEARTELTPTNLAAIEQHAIPNNNGQKAWQLSEVLASKVDLSTIKSIKISAVGETRSFGADEIASPEMTFHLRHNSRGELRLKVLRGDSEDKEAGIRDIASIDVELRKAK